MNFVIIISILVVILLVTTILIIKHKKKMANLTIRNRKKVVVFTAPQLKNISLDENKPEDGVVLSCSGGTKKYEDASIKLLQTWSSVPLSEVQIVFTQIDNGEVLNNGTKISVNQKVDMLGSSLTLQHVGSDCGENFQSVFKYKLVHKGDNIESNISTVTMVGMLTPDTEEEPELVFGPLETPLTLDENTPKDAGKFACDNGNKVVTLDANELAKGWLSSGISMDDIKIEFLEETKGEVTNNGVSLPINQQVALKDSQLKIKLNCQGDDEEPIPPSVDSDNWSRDVAVDVTETIHFSFVPAGTLGDPNETVHIRSGNGATIRIDSRDYKDIKTEKLVVSLNGVVNLNYLDIAYGADSRSVVYNVTEEQWKKVLKTYTERDESSLTLNVVLNDYADSHFNYYSKQVNGRIYRE